jgi:hypothetical protein
MLRGSKTGTTEMVVAANGKERTSRTASAFTG